MSRSAVDVPSGVTSCNEIYSPWEIRYRARWKVGCRHDDCYSALILCWNGRKRRGEACFCLYFYYIFISTDRRNSIVLIYSLFYCIVMEIILPGVSANSTHAIVRSACFALYIKCLCQPNYYIWYQAANHEPLCWLLTVCCMVTANNGIFRSSLNGYKRPLHRPLLPANSAKPSNFRREPMGSTKQFGFD